MLTSIHRKTLMGCRPRRPHLDALVAEATSGFTAPVVTWTIAGTSFTAQGDDLDVLDAEVGVRKIEAVTLEVAEAAEPGTPVVKVECGAVKGELRAIFLGLFVTSDASWHSRIHVQGDNQGNVEARAGRLEQILNKTRILRKYTEWIFLVQLALQTYLLWVSLTILTVNGDGTGGVVGKAVACTLFLFVPHMAAEAVLKFRARLTPPSPTGWWATFTSSPSTGAVLGVLGLIVAVVSVVLDAIRG
ncbi:hypothetical protein [Actinacidiphila glaucinigra]|uniref:hypothetical protein n=1 Tax=Actinacidiphila glaucinigra TaxID=235986 RepID=UPI00366B42F0